MITISKIIDEGSGIQIESIDGITPGALLFIEGEKAVETCSPKQTSHKAAIAHHAVDARRYSFSDDPDIVSLDVGNVHHCVTEEGAEDTHGNTWSR